MTNVNLENEKDTGRGRRNLSSVILVRENEVHTICPASLARHLRKKQFSIIIVVH